MLLKTEKGGVCVAVCTIIISICLTKEKSDEAINFIGFFFGFMASGFFPCRELYTLSFLKIFPHEAVENHLFCLCLRCFAR